MSVRGAASWFLRPLFRRLVLDRTHTYRTGGFRLEVSRGVFPPGWFLSSRMLVAAVLARPLRGRRLLDMGTGSGIVGLHAARAGATVLAVDVNPAAVECARANAQAHRCSNITVRSSDLFESVGPGERFDLIAWNPPFFPRDPATEAERGWFAGRDYGVLRRFSAGAAGHLLPGGLVVLVVSSDMDLGELKKVFGADGWRVSTAETRRGFFVDHCILELTQ